MYHYTESGLQNVWLANGFRTRRVEGGLAVSIADLEGLHRAIGRGLAHKRSLTGGEFRFLRKELDLSQRRIAALVDKSEEAVSKWERLGHIPNSATRLLQAIYLESIDGDIEFRKLLEELSEMDRADHDRLVFEDTDSGWREAA